MQQNVERLQIPVNDAHPVRGFDAQTDSFHQLQHFGQRQRAFFGNEVVQRTPFDIFHYQKRHFVIDDIEIRHGHNIRMADSGGGNSFLAKTLDQFGVIAQVVRQYDFDGVFGFEE